MFVLFVILILVDKNDKFVVFRFYLTYNNVMIFLTGLIRNHVNENRVEKIVSILIYTNDLLVINLRVVIILFSLVL